MHSGEGRNIVTTTGDESLTVADAGDDGNTATGIGGGSEAYAGEGDNNTATACDGATASTSGSGNTDSAGC